MGLGPTLLDVTLPYPLFIENHFIFGELSFDFDKGVKCETFLGYAWEYPLRKNLVRDNNQITVMGIPDPDIGYSKFSDKYVPDMKEASLINCQTYGQLLSQIGVCGWSCLLSVLSPTGTPEDAIYIGIKKTAKISDIEKILLPTIKKYLAPKKSKLREEKWKYYLIVHDLVKNFINYSEISEQLTQFYPEQNNLLDAKNIENYF